MSEKTKTDCKFYRTSNCPEENQSLIICYGCKKYKKDYIKIINESEKIECIGSLYTNTFFKDSEKNHIKISVKLDSECTRANTITFYRVFVFYKKAKCRNWSKCTELGRDERYYNPNIKGLSLNEGRQAVYTAMNNHWERLNPLRGYSNGTLNGIPQSFTVMPLNTTSVYK